LVGIRLLEVIEVKNVRSLHSDSESDYTAHLTKARARRISSCCRCLYPFYDLKDNGRRILVDGRWTEYSIQTRMSYISFPQNNITITARCDILRTTVTRCGTSFCPTVIPQGSTMIRCSIASSPNRQLLLVLWPGEFVVFHIHTLNLKALKSR
jgi:hypothetical protein